MNVFNLALDIGHRYKASAPNDHGAAYKGLVEADIVEYYIRKAAHDLNGVVVAGSELNVFTPDPVKKMLVGDYTTREAYANTWGVQFYLQGHINAGGGSYGFVYHNAFDLANEMAEIFADFLLQEFQGLIKPVKVELLTREERGYVILKSLKCPGLLLEPCFIDNQRHWAGLKADWPDRIASVIVKYVKKYVEETITGQCIA